MTLCCVSRVILADTYVLQSSSKIYIASRVAGGWLGGALAHAPRAHRPWYGIALTPQAGVAVGMALIAAQAFPEDASLLLTVTIGTTIIFELLGPALTLFALSRVRRHDG